MVWFSRNYKEKKNKVRREALDPNICQDIGIWQAHKGECAKQGCSCAFS
jgi:hypothetical protein